MKNRFYGLKGKEKLSLILSNFEHFYTYEDCIKIAILVIVATMINDIIIDFNNPKRARRK